MQEMQRKGDLDPYRFINYLSSIYENLNMEKKANNELNVLR